MLQRVAVPMRRSKASLGGTTVFKRVTKRLTALHHSLCLERLRCPGGTRTFQRIGTHCFHPSFNDTFSFLRTSWCRQVARPRSKGMTNALTPAKFYDASFQGNSACQLARSCFMGSLSARREIDCVAPSPITSPQLEQVQVHPTGVVKPSSDKQASGVWWWTRRSTMCGHTLPARRRHSESRDFMSAWRL